MQAKITNVETNEYFFADIQAVERENLEPTGWLNSQRYYRWNTEYGVLLNSVTVDNRNGSYELRCKSTSDYNRAKNNLPRLNVFVGKDVLGQLGGWGRSRK